MADDREGKKIREHWLALSQKYEASGMTREEFCAHEKLGLVSFDKWRGVFRKEGVAQDVPRHKRKARKQSAKQQNALVPVVITQAAEVQQVIEIRTSKGHVVSVPVGVCPTVLKEVFKALGEL